MLTRRAFLGTGAASLIIAAAGFAAVSSGTAGGCPGTITCPLTGEKVCRDKCPMIDHTRPDCPGKIECPIDGEPVCADRCPLDKPETGPATGDEEQSPQDPHDDDADPVRPSCCPS